MCALATYHTPRRSEPPAHCETGRRGFADGDDFMDDTLSQLRELAHHLGTREERARAAIGLIPSLEPYRWTGLCDVTVDEIVVIAWDGPERPSYPRFPISKNLNGAAVASKRPVSVQDVATDPRYLTTIGGTRGGDDSADTPSVPFCRGNHHVESEKVNAFAGRDESLLVACAEALQWLWA